MTSETPKRCYLCGRAHSPDCRGRTVDNTPRCYLCGQPHYPLCKDGGKPRWP